MSIAKINIHSVNARIEIQSTRPLLNMKQQHARIQIETELPKITIDQTECFNSAGLKTNTALLEDAASRARQISLEYIETTASDGRMFAALENPGDARDVVAEIATRNLFLEHEFDVVAMPSARPDIRLQRGSLKVSSIPNDLGTMNGVQFDVRLGSLETRFIPGSLSIDLKV